LGNGRECPLVVRFRRICNRCTGIIVMTTHTYVSNVFALCLVNSFNGNGNTGQLLTDSDTFQYISFREICDT